MSTAELPADEEKRIEELCGYAILDTASERDFDDIVQMASTICDTPISLITFIDRDRQWFKAKVGLTVDETSRDVAFCSHAILNDEMLIVKDAMHDDRFHDNPLVIDDPSIRFYAGMPLICPSGYKLGTLCVIDRKPRQLSELQELSLKILSRQIIKLLELRKKNAELNHLSEVNNMMLSIIGHDLRSPLVSLYNLIKMSEMRNMSLKEFSIWVDEIRESVNNSIELATNLVMWASSNFNENKIELEEINLKSIVEKIFRNNSSVIKLKGNRAESGFENNIRVHADKNMIEFVVRNLVLNANKFSTAGIITVNAQQTPGFIEISVTDTGIGMKPDQLSALFKWEARRSTTGTNGEKGSGLGLIFCHHFIHMHGGNMWVTSKPGMGTTFHFTVPVVQFPEVSEISTSMVDSSQGREGDEKIQLK